MLRKPLPRKRSTPRTRRCAGCSVRISTARCNTCGTRRETKRGNIGKRCDALWASWVKRGGKCFLCGNTEGIEAAHIIGRAQRVTRWLIDPPNGIALCHQHHRAFDTYKLDREDLIVRAIGAENYKRLRTIALGVWDRHYPIAELAAALAAAKEKP